MLLILLLPIGILAGGNAWVDRLAAELGTTRRRLLAAAVLVGGGLAAVMCGFQFFLSSFTRATSGH
ncbi:hypothetical protein SH661x_004688 [Planctomicrobium sp. SH661]|uniref:hypothetical protein n=1 Tax=Planctomicrobium sp. SH661 TaxID=3448124 RepID=UPI003F5B3F69